MGRPYTSKLLDLARDFRHGGAMEAPTSVGKSSCDGRPPFTTFYLRLSEGRVSDASFQTFGCGVAIAACEALAALANAVKDIFQLKTVKRGKFGRQLASR